MTRFKIHRPRTLFFYAQDSRGLGHINRTVTIARHVLATHPDCVGYLATKSPWTGNFTLPPRCDCIKLPTRLAAGPETVEESERARERFRRIRGQLLRESVLGLAPDLVLVDHEPLGSGGEFRDGLYALKRARPQARFILGLRDIMDDAERIRDHWRELGVYDALEKLYHGIAVYGSAGLYDVAGVYAIPESVRPKLHYCGYVVRDLPSADPRLLRRRHGLPEEGSLVLATAGSGSDGYPVLEAAREALEGLRGAHPGLAAVVVTGPLMPKEQQAALEARAASWCRVLHQADIVQLMAAADAVLSMGGYNSICEALALGRPLVLVPRATHKVEQKIRAELLAERGLARCVLPQALNPRSLAEALDWALRRDPAAHAARIRAVIPSFDGARRVTDYLSRWLAGDVP